VVGAAERIRSATGGGVSGFTLAGGERLHSHHASPSEEKASASSPQTTQEASSGFSSPRTAARSARRHNPCAPTVFGVPPGFRRREVGTPQPPVPQRLCRCSDLQGSGKLPQRYPDTVCNCIYHRQVTDFPE